MLKSQREQEILSVLKKSDGFVSVKSLCKQLFASESSIRSDLTAMENKGYVKRSYGGAHLVSELSKVTVFDFRFAQNAQAKTEIAKKAVTLINDNSVIFIDQSS
ncbi:MAG: DeoR/GlpR transcriptional regulator, partial [Clostridia bacterium]|nr:DeoR/GlpR transcriptional regulator [Clostridia bacterium]